MPEIPQQPSPERKKLGPIKILVLEDQYSSQAESALRDKGFDVRVVRTLEELKNVESEFEPDIVILDKNVPEKEGEEAKDLSATSLRIAKEKWPNAITAVYSSLLHHGRIVGPMFGGDLLEADRGSFEREYNDKSPMVIDAVESLGDKSSPESWTRLLELLPLLISSSKTEKLVEIWQRLPNDVREKARKYLGEFNPGLLNSLERRMVESQEPKRESRLQKRLEITMRYLVSRFLRNPTWSEALEREELVREYGALSKIKEDVLNSIKTEFPDKSSVSNYSKIVIEVIGRLIERRVEEINKTEEIQNKALSGEITTFQAFLRIFLSIFIEYFENRKVVNLSSEITVLEYMGAYINNVFRERAESGGGLEEVIEKKEAINLVINGINNFEKELENNIREQTRIFE